LVPDYLTHLPRDPALVSDPNRQYLYRCDGHDFKLLCHGAEDCDAVRSFRPGILDPVRDGWAYGFWTGGGVSW
jgi:hypothetical protein